jgi:catechol 2,3-dioxygenase-like lactoylglutathione lyase family enzyme
MLCKKLHHAAFRCKDAAETTDFYTRILGLKFAHAMGEDHVPSTGRYSPHVHIFFEMEDGSNIAFFEVPQDEGEPSGRDPRTPDWLQHFAFEVESLDALMEAKADLEAKGLRVVGPTNHDDFITSIYFFDPSGHRLELTVRTCEPARYRVFEKEAPEVLALWNERHDWSQREKVFGAKSGYARDAGRAAGEGR